MKNDRTSTYSTDVEDNLYPHFKITNETFPRVLATRVGEDDGSEYFGPFLPKTSARILIDFLNRKFRLRTCDLDIDGSFPVPCTMYYRKRCLAPCVASICDRERYLSRVDLVRLFLKNNRMELQRRINLEMQAASANLDFEAAAEWRDLLESLAKWWSNKRLDLWLDDAVDTIATEETDEGVTVYLVTQRDRYVLGRKVFAMPDVSQDDALYQVLTEFYRVGLPREIRVYREFRDRKNVEALLTERFNRAVSIKVVRRIDQRITARRALHSTRSENEIDRVKRRMSGEKIGRELKRIFNLADAPGDVDAFDVAHISGQKFVAASAVWIDGKFSSPLYRFHLSEENSELTALADAVMFRLADPWHPIPGLIVLDGGKSQLNAVISTWTKTDLVRAPVVAAVKPKGKHSQISHFLTADGREIGFDPENPAHGMLQLLRDEAHDLSNRVHRDLRDMGHFYEVAALLPSSTESERRQIIARAGTIRKLVELSEDEIRKTFDREVAERVLRDLDQDPQRLALDVRPLIVPIRFVAENGNADDLIPIESR